MDLVTIYHGLGDATRLRILNLLREGPLCVCHIQEVLDEPQVKVSKHLGYLKSHGLVSVRRAAMWRIYSLFPKPHPVLAANLACLRDCTPEHATFRRDAKKLQALRANPDTTTPPCCPPPTLPPKRKPAGC